MAPKTKEQYLSDAAGNADDALSAAVRDAARNMNANSAARAFKRAYEPLVLKLKLPVDIDTDEDEIKGVQAQAEQALGKLSAPPADEEDEGVIDALTAIIETYAEATGVDLPAVLQDLPDDADDAAVDARLTEAFAPITALQDRAQRADLQDAAAFAGKPVDALADYLEGKTWGKRTVRGEDGTEREEWGIGEGERFRPLTAVPGLQALAPAPERPAPAPLPTGQRGGNAPAPKTVEQRTAEVRKEISI